MTLTVNTILAYSASCTAFSMLSTAFSFYYVKVFMNLYHIEEKWFHSAQVLYLIWNAINDPLFAYFQDSTNFKFTRTRRESIKYSGPLFALSFMLPWIPIADTAIGVGIHLIVSLFIWDTLFTFVGLAQCTLSTELTADPLMRIRLNRYSTIGSLIGSSSVMLLEYTSDSLRNFRSFQITASIISLCSTTLFSYVGRNAHTVYDLRKVGSVPDLKIEVSHDKNTEEPYWKQTWQILSDRNFLSFVIANFCQEFHRAFLSNFMAILGDYLIADIDVSREGRKLFYGGVTICPQILVILGNPLVARFSYFNVMRWSYIYKVIAGVVMFCIGQNNPWCLMLFLLLDSCFSNASYSLLTLPLSDITDQNMIKHKRKHPISSMVFGTNALVVKPAISLSPMLVVAILNQYGYSQLNQQLTDKSVASPELQSVMFLLICGYPIILGTVQLISWSYYAIRNPRSENIELLIKKENSE